MTGIGRGVTKEGPTYRIPIYILYLIHTVALQCRSRSRDEIQTGLRVSDSIRRAQVWGFGFAHMQLAEIT